MNTSEFLLTYWHWNLVPLLFSALALIFHYVSNNYRFTRKSPQFIAAIILFLITTLSPLNYLGMHFLFSAHMVNHVVLLLIIPPLMLTATDKDYLNRMAEKKLFRKITDTMFSPFIAWLWGVGSMWIMHIPPVMKALDRSMALRDFQMILLPILGVFFIWPAFSPIAWKRLHPLLSSLYLFLACIGCTVLGILITFAPAGMFTSGMPPGDAEVNALIHQVWGINARNDQMAGGLIMWVPACFIYVTNIMFVLNRWLPVTETAEPVDKNQGQ